LEVGAKLGLSDDIARAACVRLEKDFDLIHRPDGGRSGYRLTAAGKAILSSASNRPG
jgi:DNA-binding transcriptional regulator PaaX